MIKISLLNSIFYLLVKYTIFFFIKKIKQLGQEKRKLKTVQLMLFLYLLALIGCSTGEEEVYVLPKNYVGVVYVIFNQKTGEQPKYEAGKRVYEIPPNGILKTQFGFNEGWHGIPEYYYADGKSMKSLFYQIENRDIKADTLQVCCIQNGKSYKVTNEAVRYERFFVGTKQQIDSLYEVEQKRDVSELAE